LLEKAEQGDLTQRLSTSRKDEFGKMIEIINTFLDTLHKVTSDINSTSEMLDDSTGQLTTISREINTTANEQAAAVSEVVATVEQFANMSKQIASNATGVAQLAAKTEDDVIKGVGYVKTSLDRMRMIKSGNENNIMDLNKLGKKVEKINEILKFINTVADRTKLIAFNAALEASSSEGEAGKRFGIVATEIRRLAENVVESIADIDDSVSKIMKATHELSKSLEQSSIRIVEGYKQAEDTAEVLDTISNSSKETNQSAGKIDHGISQVQISLDQIVATLKEIADGIQHFVGATKESDDITLKITELSQHFTQAVTKFQLMIDEKDTKVPTIEPEN